MRFWYTCYKVLGMTIPNEIEPSSSHLFAMLEEEMRYCNPAPRGVSALMYQFQEKTVYINIVPRHKSTDR